MSSVPAFVDVSGGLCDEPGSFCARQRAVMLQECYTCLKELAAEEGKSRGDTEVTQVGTTKSG